MSLKIDIEKIFADNTSYANPGQAVNQASSLNALSGDLYTDSKRFIYELLQNADDSSQNKEAVSVFIKTFDDYLVVAHSGRPFTPRDLQGICNVNNGTKKSDPTKTGYKGIGFKSVFGQSQRVIIYTNNEYFRFDSSYPFIWKWEGTKEGWQQHNDREFQFPWQIIPIATDRQDVLEPIDQYLQKIGAKVATIIQLKNPEETRQAVISLSQNLNMFLFLKNITNIYFDISTPISIEIDRTEQSKLNLKQNGTLKDSWLVNTVSLTVPGDLKDSLQEERNIPEKLLSAQTIELSLAAKVGSEGIVKLTAQERLLYSYLPTDETRYSIPVLVNTSFLTTANREALHADSKWNHWLFKNIAIEIFKWISKLVSSEFQYQAYRLIPEKTVLDLLGNEFNKGIKEAIETIPFILTNENELVRIEETIVDFTFLSENDFVGAAPVKSFIVGEGGNSIKKFAKNTGFGFDFKKLGASSFEWKDLYSFLTSQSFKKSYTIRNNIALIKHFKFLCDSHNIKEISTETLRNLPFIWDHKNGIKQPTQLCFPAADDQNWNTTESDLSFLHPKLQDWLLKEPELRVWLETLGMTEKTDITYITQTILPHIESYVTLENAIQSIQDLFILFRKGELKEELIKRLSKIKLLTKLGSLVSADECFLSDFYSPRLKLEEILQADIFVSIAYCSKNADRDEWKRFFKMLGAKEGISILLYSPKHSDKELIQSGFYSEYFKTDDKKFKPFITTFTSDTYQDINTLDYIHFTENNPKFAVRFWCDFIENNSTDTIDSPAVAFWGEPGRPGRIGGNKVENYIPWFVSNRNCIPVASGECRKSNSVLLNTTEIISIAGPYLPVFDGPELPSNWKSFLRFRTSLGLQDYLDLLTNISLDIDDKGRIKSENHKRIQSIYTLLLQQFINWSSDDISKVEEWATAGCLLNTKRQFTNANTLKYFLDGNEAIFQDQFNFLALSAENRNHPNIEDFLSFFKVNILRQSDFELEYTRKEVCSGLIKHLKVIAPYFKIWIENEVTDEKTTEYLENIQTKITALNIYQAEELKIKYAGIDFVKNVAIHFDEPNLFVTNPWSANSVLLKLSEVLCRYFYLVGHDKKLDFLLRSTLDEIRKYFAQENIIIPQGLHIVDPDVQNVEQISDVPTNSSSLKSFEEIENAINEGRIIPEEFFHTSRVNYEALKYAEGLISRAVNNVLEYLKALPEYDCTSNYMIAKSIIGGITKMGMTLQLSPGRPTITPYLSIIHLSLTFLNMLTLSFGVKMASIFLNK